MNLPTGTRLGPYEIVGPLAKGGMGEVYRARDPRLNRVVAIKILPAEGRDREGTRRFDREARAVASLSHPHIVALFDVGEQDGVAYVVTELVEGETLRARLAHGALRPEEAAELAAQVAEGLSAAHVRGLVHRDIKPENIVLTPEGKAKILDFGLAKTDAFSERVASGESDPTASSLTEPGLISGTLGYMSPEQVRGEPVDARSDIFALGTVLYEMLAGRKAFSGASKVETLNAILKEEPDSFPPSAQIPEELARVLQRCLAKRRENRYHSAADLAHDLRTGSAAARSIPAISGPGIAKRSSRAGIPWLALAAAVVIGGVAILLWSRRSSAPDAPRTLAVLPFQTLGAEPAPQFGLGLADSVIGRLAAIRELTVRPTSAVRRFEGSPGDAIEAGRELDVDAVLEGRLQKLEGKTRVSVQMTDVSRGAIVWSDQLELPEGRLFEIQDAIAGRVVERLRLQIDPAERRRLSDAQKVPDDVMEQYFGARAKLPEAIRMGVERRRELVTSLDRILERAPDFARAIGARSYARAMLNFQDPSPEGFQAAMQDAERSLALEPHLAEPRVARASLYWSSLGGWKVVEAVRELRAAIAQNPGTEIAHLDLTRILYHTGWLDEAREAVVPARRLNPTGPEVTRISGHLAWYSGDPRGALAEFQRLPPDLLAESLGGRWQVLHLRLLVESPSKVAPDVEAWAAEAQARTHATWLPDSLLALARVLQGRMDIDDLEKRIASANPDASAGHFHHVDHLLAEAHAVRRDFQRSVEHLRRASKTGLNCIPCFENDRLLAPTRATAEYRELKAEMEKRDEGFRAALKIP
ncbi:MAG TPA: serine/threonine-protein kinase [Thermoanaerobaculia bacterium]